MAKTTIVALVGFRCCGKSTVRQLLAKAGYPVFDTNSVRTGDADANQISIDEILGRYGRGESYLNFIKNQLEEFVLNRSGVLFLDSAKVAADDRVLRGMFPSCRVEMWYLHASNAVRLARYLKRDVDSNIRSENLEEHDAALERNGIGYLIKAATEAINTDDDLQYIEGRLSHCIKKLRERVGFRDGL
jgi:dephospho-CoA kinase